VDGPGEDQNANEGSSGNQYRQKVAQLGEECVSREEGEPPNKNRRNSHQNASP
jgi:hypothetical protein